MVRHILADGREVESIEGMVIPNSGPSAAVYRIAAEFIQNHPEVIYQSKEGRTNETTTA